MRKSYMVLAAASIAASTPALGHAATFVATPASPPANATSSTAMVPNNTSVSSDGTGVFDVSYYVSGQGSANQATRFNLSGGVQVLGNLGATGTTIAGSTVTAIGVNDIAVGTSTEGSYAGSTRAVYWAAGSSTPTELNSLNSYDEVQPGFSKGTANAISASGLIVGQSQLYSSDGYSGLGTRAVYWTTGNTTATELGSLGTSTGATLDTGATSAAATAVNASGTIVGYAINYNTGSPAYGASNYHAVRWNPGSTTAVDLNVLSTSNGQASGNGTSQATAINASGTIVGTSTLYGPSTQTSSGTYNLGTRAVRWAAGATTPTQLMPLNTTSQDVQATYSFTAAGNGTSTAYAINAAGVTVGSSELYATGANTDLGKRPVFWAAGSTAATQLGTPAGESSNGSSGYGYSEACSINAGGLIAGYESIYSGADTSQNHAIIWLANGTPVDLNTMSTQLGIPGGFVLNTANAISDSNWISGLATYTSNGSSTTEAYLVDGSILAAPEPTSIALLGLPAGALVFRRSRRASVTSV